MELSAFDKNRRSLQLREAGVVGLSIQDFDFQASCAISLNLKCEKSSVTSAVRSAATRPRRDDEERLVLNRVAKKRVLGRPCRKDEEMKCNTRKGGSSPDRGTRSRGILVIAALLAVGVFVVPPADCVESSGEQLVPCPDGVGLCVAPPLMAGIGSGDFGGRAWTGGGTCFMDNQT